MRIGIDASRAFVKNPTGTERYSYEVITRILKLPEAKKHTWILYVKPKVQDSRFKVQSNVQIKEILMKYLWTQIGLAWRTWMDNLDVLWVPAHTLPVLRRSGIRTVVTVHGIEYEWLPAYENLLQRWYLPLSTQYVVKSAQKIIAVSEFTKKQLVKRLGAEEKKISVTYEGVTTSPLTPLLNSGEGNGRGEVLKKYGLKSKQYVLFIGTIQPRKNLQRLIEAFARFKVQDSRFKLVIAGKLGWGYEEVVEMAKKHEVIITGYINEAERYSLLRNALVYVQPSITEGFGLPVLEAMAAGVPVVSSQGGALREILQIPNPKSQIPSYAGLLFDPYDVEDMSRSLSLVIDNHSLQEELIKKGKERVKQFSWDKAVRETYKILISKS